MIEGAEAFGDDCDNFTSPARLDFMKSGVKNVQSVEENQ